MPSFDTHYAFGVSSLRGLNPSYVKECCQKHPIPYNLGNQGPDSCFFFLQAILHKKTLGRLMHTTNTGAFFTNMYKRIVKLQDPLEQEVAVAYLAGFLGHYALDTATHPFIYARTDFDKEDPQYSIRHAILETDLDFVVVKNVLQTLPSYLPRHKYHWLNRFDEKVLRKLFIEATCDTYPTEPAFSRTCGLDFYIMPMTWAPFHNRSGKQKRLFQRIEKALHVKATLSSQIPEDHRAVNKDPLNKQHDAWANPWDASLVSTESFTDLFKKARDKHRKLLRQLNAALSNKDKSFSIGESLSYLSGLSDTIPY